MNEPKIINIVVWRIEETENYCNYLCKKIYKDNIGKVSAKLRNLSYNIQHNFVELKIVYKREFPIIVNILPIPKSGPLISLELNNSGDFNAILFMADLDEEYETLLDMELSHLKQILSRENFHLQKLPVVIQYNKFSSLKASIEHINYNFNKLNAPYFESAINHFDTSYSSITQLLAIILGGLDIRKAEKPLHAIPDKKKKNDSQHTKETIVKGIKTHPDRTEIISKEKEQEIDLSFNNYSRDSEAPSAKKFEADFSGEENYPEYSRTEVSQLDTGRTTDNGSFNLLNSDESFETSMYTGNEDNSCDMSEEKNEEIEVLVVKEPQIIRPGEISLPVVLRYKKSKKEITATISLNLSDLLTKLSRETKESKTTSYSTEKGVPRFTSREKTEGSKRKKIDSTELIFKK